MTAARPIESPILRWLMDGVNAKALILGTAMLCAFYFGLVQRIAIDEQQIADLRMQVDEQRAALPKKVDVDEYAKDQTHVDTGLARIEASVDHIETILMEKAQK
jgi:hypothetical protein